MISLLLLDNSKEYRNLLENIFADDHLLLAQATDLDTGLEQLNICPYSAVILDPTFTNMNTIKVVSSVIQVLREIPLFIFSIYPFSAEDHKTFYELGVKGVFYKKSGQFFEFRNIVLKHALMFPLQGF